MSISARTPNTERRVCLVLEDTAHHLTSLDLFKITEAAQQVHAIVHIRHGSWQVLISVQEPRYPELDRVLQTMGYEARMLSGESDERSTFVLNG